MRYLPPLETAAGPSTLPMADATAVALSHALLCATMNEACAILKPALHGDPALAVWTFCCMGKSQAAALGAMDGLAAWLAKNALRVLSWPEGGRFLDLLPVSALSVKEALALVEKAAAVSLIAPGLAGTRPDTVLGEKAVLRGLLCAASQWLAWGTGRRVEEAGPPLIPWLEGVLTKRIAATDAVERALKCYAENSLPSELQAAQPDWRQHAGEATSVWAASVENPIADRLPMLAARLARLAELEPRFQETLELEKLEAMAEFAAGAGHEINNPLSVIAGRAQLLLHEATDPEHRRSLALINAQAMRVFEMIADVRLFARPPRPEPGPFDLAVLLQRIVEELAAEAKRREIVFGCGNMPAALPVEADPVQIAVAVRAICQNALEAIGVSGRIELSVEQVDDEVRIHIRDNGPGILPEQRRHIFDPYYSARQAGRGLGLGLSKAWSVVKSHQGRIEVESEAGHGASFTIVIPRQFPT